MSKSKKVIYVENLSVAELITMLGGFCDEADKYVKYHKNHKGLFRELQHKADSDGWHVVQRLQQKRVVFAFSKKEAPDDVVAAVQKFFRPKKVANATIQNALQKLPYEHYRAEYTLDNPKRFDRKFQEFMNALTEFLNKKWGAHFEFKRRPK